MADNRETASQAQSMAEMKMEGIGSHQWRNKW